MKTQMRFQKILMLVSLIIAALTFVYALSFCGGTIYKYVYPLDRNRWTVPGTFSAMSDEIADLYYFSQQYCTTLVGLSIAFIVIIAFNYIMGNQSRRKYYITNYISIGITVAYAIVMAVMMIIYVSNTLALFNAIDAEYMIEGFASRYDEELTIHTYNFVLGYILAGVVILDAAALVCNLLLKIKLMKGEKALLANTPVEEVA